MENLIQNTKGDISVLHSVTLNPQVRLSADQSGSSNEEGSSATSVPVAEDNGPSGSYSSVAHDVFCNVSPLIPAVEKSRTGSCIYNKKQYCMYCK